MAQQTQSQTHTLSDVPDDELLSRLGALVRDSRRVEADLVAHIGEVDQRKLYARFAFPSMYAYCTEALHLTEAEAYRRITVARAARRHEMLLPMLRDGRVHISGLASLVGLLTPANRDDILRRATHASRREIERLVAELKPKPDVRAMIRKLPDRSVGLPEPSAGLPDRPAGPNPPAGLPDRPAGSPDPLGLLDRPAGLPDRPPVQEPATAVGSGPQAERSGWDSAGTRPPRAAVPCGALLEREELQHGIIDRDDCEKVEQDELGATAFVAGAESPTSGTAALAFGALSPASGRISVPDTQLFPGRVVPRSSEGPDVRGAAIQPLSPGRHKVQFTASDDLREKLERLRGLMRSEVPSGDLSAIIDKAVTEKLARLEARRFGIAKAPRKALSASDVRPTVRRIPAAVRRAVWVRDEGRCRFVDELGRRCDERLSLEFHHRVPYAAGGDHSVGNVCLMCRAHNQRLAERDFGKAAVQQRRGGRTPRSESRAQPTG